MRKTQAVFLDTNVYLDYSPIDKVDWLQKIFTKASEVKIVVPPMIHRELGLKKDGFLNTEMRSRVQNIIRLLDGLADKAEEGIIEIKPNVIVYFEWRDPVIEPPLNATISDDHLIASMLLYRTEHLDEEIVLMTGDINLKNKARSHQFQTHRMPDLYLSPRPSDPREKQIKLLEKQIEQMSSSLPKLEVTFLGGEKHQGFALVQDIPMSDFEQEMEKIKRAHPLIKPKFLPPPTLPTSDPASLSGKLEAMARQHQEQIRAQFADFASLDFTERKYNDALEDYYLKSHTFLKKRQEYEKQMYRTVEINLNLSNQGSTPADDVEVHLLFGPIGVPSKRKPEAPEPPRPPRKSEILLGGLPHYAHLHAPVGLGKESIPVRIRREGSIYTVHFQIDRAKHGFTTTLPPLFVRCLSDVSVTLLVRVLIHAENLPVAQQDSLYFEFNITNDDKTMGLAPDPLSEDPDKEN